jgi:hypothetical protein
VSHTLEVVNAVWRCRSAWPWEEWLRRYRVEIRGAAATVRLGGLKVHAYRSGAAMAYTRSADPPRHPGLADCALKQVVARCARRSPISGSEEEVLACLAGLGQIGEALGRLEREPSYVVRAGAAVIRAFAGPGGIDAAVIFARTLEEAEGACRAFAELQCPR